jgi:hypothetical protein
MDYGKILKRAWHMVWRYRALWVFGVILALTTGGGGNNWFQYMFNREDLPPGAQLRIDQMSPEMASTLIAIGIGLAFLIVILIIAAAVARYVSETALIRMVDEHEQTGQQRSVRQGFRLGWSRTAWRLFLIDLLIGVPVVLAFILMFALAAAPLFLWATESTAAGAFGTALTIGLGLLVILLAIVVGVILSVLMRFFRRVCVLERRGVTESIRRGYFMVRQNVRDVAVLWLITLGLGIGWGIVMIPVTLVVLFLGAVLGGLPALLAGVLADLAFGGAVPWIVGLAVGIPLFTLVVAGPLLFLGGLWEVFKSSVWTLTYRELRAKAEAMV